MKNLLILLSLFFRPAGLDFASAGAGMLGGILGMANAQSIPHANFNIPGMSTFSAHLNRGDWMFNTLFAALIIFFTFFYTAVTVQPVDIAENLKKQQANIPGIRPGKQTAEYLDRVLTRLTVAGAVYIAVICIVPSVIASSFRIPFQFGGTSLMIVVGVALETVNQIEAHLITRSYEGLTGPRMTRLSGRRS